MAMLSTQIYEMAVAYVFYCVLYRTYPITTPVAQVGTTVNTGIVS